MRIALLVLALRLIPLEIERVTPHVIVARRCRDAKPLIVPLEDISLLVMMILTAAMIALCIWMITDSGPRSAAPFFGVIGLVVSIVAIGTVLFAWIDTLLRRAVDLKVVCRNGVVKVVHRWKDGRARRCRCTPINALYRSQIKGHGPWLLITVEFLGWQVGLWLKAPEGEPITERQVTKILRLKAPGQL